MEELKELKIDINKVLMGKDNTKIIESEKIREIKENTRKLLIKEGIERYKANSVRVDYTGGSYVSIISMDKGIQDVVNKYK